MSDTALGIDIGSHAVKAVLLRRRGSRIQIVRAGSAMLEELGHMEDSHRKISKEAMILRNLLRSMGVRSRLARIAVAGRKSIIRYTRVPPAPAWRLKMLIDYEIEGDTEGKSKDLAYDFRLLDLPTSHIEFTVMMAMAKNELVESRCEILEEAGDRVDNVTLTPFPVLNTFLQSRGPSVEDDKTTLLVDVGSENLNLVVERNGRLFFARNISPGGRAFAEAVQDEFRLSFPEAEELKCTKGRLLLGGEALSTDETQISPSADAPTEIAAPGGDEAEGLPGFLDEVGPQLSTTDSDQTAQLSEAMLPVAGRLASAIQSSLMYCRAQTRMTELEVDEMVLTGGGAKLPGLRQALSRRLGIPVVPADPLKGFDLSPLRREAREEAENNAETYATAVGLALPRLKPDAVDFSLLPRKLKQRRHFLEKTVYLWLAGAAMVALMILLGYSSWTNTKKLENYVNLKEARRVASDKAKVRMENLQLVNSEYGAEVSLMRKYYLTPQQQMKAFGALARLVPPEVELTSFIAPPRGGKGKEREVVIEGYVRERVKDQSGRERRLDKSHAHPIIGKLRDDLTADPVFDAPPAPQSVIQREILRPGKNSIAAFTLKLVIAEVKNESAVGGK